MINVNKLPVILFLLALLGCSNSQKPADGKVIAVKDGDTIEIMENGQPVRVRLAEVDAPEKNQDFGTQARKFTSDLSFGKEVSLQRHNTDRYGRVVAKVFLPDGRCLNEELVSQGYAWHYKDYSKDPSLARLEADARTYRRGLWAHPNPVAPWEFRKMQREGKLKKPGPTSSNTARANGAENVWVCSSKTVKYYHVSSACSRLRNCSKEVQQLTLQEADELGKGKRCTVCG